jgi:hypothetical protein
MTSAAATRLARRITLLLSHVFPEKGIQAGILHSKKERRSFNAGQDRHWESWPSMVMLA